MHSNNNYHQQLNNDDPSRSTSSGSAFTGGAGVGVSSIVSTSSIPRSSLLTCSFNQDGGCLAIGTTTGFSVHNLYPHYAVSVCHDSAQQQQTIQSTTTNSNGNNGATSTSTTGNGNNNKLSLLNGGIGLIELLFRCNIMLLVGGGINPHTPPHRVLIWDDHICKPIGELSFRQTVLCVKLRKDTIAIALRDRCYVYDLNTLTLRDKIYTSDNPHGLLCISTTIHDIVLACPAVTTGHVRVELYGLRKCVLMEAHESSLRALALTADGSKLATASEKGTIIRIFDVSTASCVNEFRRGYERATIKCLTFSWNYLYVACCSDKGTTHIFQLNDENEEQTHYTNHGNKSTSTGGNSRTNGIGSNVNNGSNNKNDSTAMSLTSMILSTVRKSVGEGDYKKSVCQIRGVPHPLSCAFIGEAQTIQLAVAGWDADGNGVLLISEYTPPPSPSASSTASTTNATSTGKDMNTVPNEPKRIGYHVLCRSENYNLLDESEDTRRRRRLMRGWIPEIPATPEGAKIYVGERLEVRNNNTIQREQEEVISILDHIRFEENENDYDEFVCVTTTTTNSATTTTATTNPAATSNNSHNKMVTTTTTTTPTGLSSSSSNQKKQIISTRQPEHEGSTTNQSSSSTPSRTGSSNGTDTVVINETKESSHKIVKQSLSQRQVAVGVENSLTTSGDGSIRTEPFLDDDDDDDEVVDN